MPSVAPLRHVAAFVRNGWPESSEYAPSYAFGENVPVFDPFRQPGPVEIFQDSPGVFPGQGQSASELWEGDASPTHTNPQLGPRSTSPRAERGGEGVEIMSELINNQAI
jgi:hypothetical protein